MLLPVWPNNATRLNKTIGGAMRVLDGNASLLIASGLEAKRNARAHPAVPSFSG